MKIDSSNELRHQQTKLDDNHDSDRANFDQVQLPNGNRAIKRQARRLAEFYADKTILITGVTGFIGKIFLIKLVNSFKDCKKIYVMLRPKKGMTPQQRFNKLISEEPFVLNEASRKLLLDKGLPVYDSTPGLWSKVVAIEGDMSSPDLGIASDIKETIINSVELVFNIAASVSFDAPLKQNLRDNYIGTKNILELSAQFKELISFVHVSTFYSNSHIQHVEERVIPLSRDCEKMAELIDWMPEDLCNTLGVHLMENRPNTYILTKAMAENLVQKYQGKMPISIVRPSIVTPSLKDPYPGWVDNVNGPMGLGVLASLGILRNIDWNYYGVSDIVPVDCVVNNMIAVAERTPRLYPNEIKVYNCSTSSANPLTWGGMFELLRTESFKAPPYKMLRTPIVVPKHKRANKIGFALTKLSEILFAYFIDFILMICGQKQVLSKLTSKLHHGYDMLRPFTTTEYTCSNDNLFASYEELHEQDKNEFDFDLRKIDWSDYTIQAYYGSRRRLLREDLSNVPAARLKMKILFVVEYVFSLLMYALLAWSAYKVYGQVRHYSLLPIQV